MKFRRLVALTLPATLLMFAGIDSTFAQVGRTHAGANDRAEDRAAIRAAMDSFARAFEARDAKALAAHWTDEGEYQSDEAAPIKGREKLAAAFAPLFAAHPKVKATNQAESLRFVSRDGAIEEGIVTINRGSSEPASKARYTALFAREDGRWKLAQLTEVAIEETTLDELAWLVGEWKSKEQDTEVATTYAWEGENKKFLRVKFSIKEKDGRTLGGSQFLGVDPASGEIRTWTFEAAGGIGEGVWVRDGDHWTVEAAGTTADGRSMTATNVLRRINDDLFTWQSISRKLDDQEIGDLAPVKVTRVKAEKR